MGFRYQRLLRPVPSAAPVNLPETAILERMQKQGSGFLARAQSCLRTMTLMSKSGAPTSRGFFRGYLKLGKTRIRVYLGPTASENRQISKSSLKPLQLETNFRNLRVKVSKEYLNLTVTYLPCRELIVWLRFFAMP